MSRQACVACAKEFAPTASQARFPDRRGRQVCSEACRRKMCGTAKSQLINLVGKRFGSLTVTKYLGYKPPAGRWEAVCDCGRKTSAASAKIRSGLVRSCGCGMRKLRCSGCLVAPKRFAKDCHDCTRLRQRENGRAWVAANTERSQRYQRAYRYKRDGHGDLADTLELIYQLRRRLIEHDQR